MLTASPNSVGTAAAVGWTVAAPPSGSATRTVICNGIVMLAMADGPAAAVATTPDMEPDSGAEPTGGFAGTLTRTAGRAVAAPGSNRLSRSRRWPSSLVG